MKTADRNEFVNAMHAHERDRDTLTVRDFVCTLLIATGLGFNAAVFLYVLIFC